MKNRKLKMIFAGMMVMGSTAYTFAAEKNTESAAESTDAEYYYVGNDDKMLEIHAIEEDNSDPMDPKTKDSVTILHARSQMSIITMMHS